MSRHITISLVIPVYGVEKYITEIIAERIELCGRAGSKSPVVIEAQPPKPTTSPMQDSIGDLPPDDDWPF